MTLMTWIFAEIEENPDYYRVGGGLKEARLVPHSQSFLGVPWLPDDLQQDLWYVNGPLYCLKILSQILRNSREVFNGLEFLSFCYL